MRIDVSTSRFSRKADAKYQLSYWLSGLAWCLPTFYLTFWPVFSMAAQQQMPFCTCGFSACALKSQGNASVWDLRRHEFHIILSWEVGICKTLTISNPKKELTRFQNLRVACPYFPPIALKNPRVGWKILNRFLQYLTVPLYTIFRQTQKNCG